MDLTMEFIEKNARQPFCVFLSWHPPHAPYTEAPQRFRDMYPAEKLKLRPNVPADGDLKRIREAYTGYFSPITAQDEELGRLMKKLEQLGIADNTIACYRFRVRRIPVVIGAKDRLLRLALCGLHLSPS